MDELQNAGTLPAHYIAPDYHRAARRYAQKSQWASAVLYWHMAAANAPPSGQFPA